MNQRPSGYELRFVCGGETFRLISGPSGSGKPRSEALFVPLVPWILIPVWVRVWVRSRENPKVRFPLEKGLREDENMQNLPCIDKERLRKTMK